MGPKENEAQGPGRMLGTCRVGALPSDAYWEPKENENVKVKVNCWSRRLSITPRDSPPRPPIRNGLRERDRHRDDAMNDLGGSGWLTRVDNGSGVADIGGVVGMLGDQRPRVLHGTMML